MSRSEFEAICSALPGTSHVVQWGGASVFKVGGKIFAIQNQWNDPAIAFKVPDESYAMLTEQAGIHPAPYLARAKWVQVSAEAGFTSADFKAYLTQAHSLIAAKLTKKLREDLGLG
ncbi:MmcQ/YjbR family DNA-binding protein [Cucumibacter marinus]|uniref:MmcQ/YjbR family DNA-binding protein n=1 Tax=Cucumibacter marinus TaxID=1121252 RepID=UPI000491952B|nr:MmcQ/YjbR family DNA-binding protein [Cucumibacter marinus]